MLGLVSGQAAAKSARAASSSQQGVDLRPAGTGAGGVAAEHQLVGQLKSRDCSAALSPAVRVRPSASHNLPPEKYSVQAAPGERRRSPAR